MKDFSIDQIYSNVQVIAKTGLSKELIYKYILAEFLEGFYYSSTEKGIPLELSYDYYSFREFKYMGPHVK